MKNRFGRLASTIAVGAIVALGAGACASPGETPPSSSDDGPIYLAGISGVSGVAATYGEQTRAGEAIALAQINDAGGINGRQVQIDHEDSRFDIPTNVALFKRFAADSKYVAVLGPADGSGGIATTPFANEAGLVSIVAGGSAPWTVPFGDFVFRLPPQNKEIIAKTVKAAVDAWGIKSAAIIYASDADYAVAAKDLYEAVAADLGIEIKRVESFESTQQNFAPQLTNIAAANVDAVLMSVVAANAGPMLLQAQNLGLEDMHWVGDAGAQNASLWELSQGNAQGLITGTPFDVTSKNPEVVEFVEAFQAKHGTQPTIFNAYGYDSVRLLGQAIAAIDGEITRESVRDALAGITYEGVTGTISFPDGSGNAAREGIFVLVMDNGKFIPF
ncbi:ABC transporter substrate-binding protein [Leifsonia bigeumensis]|uniref:ABC transporter substrate-binding protein n=1 Tax=Leifsonella bigeumensis TaxID=433643 RepID=A0ABP7F8Y3_9MICO